MNPVLSVKIVCIHCGYVIIGAGLRSGRECPRCRVPMYEDGGDFRINRGPVDDVGFITRVYSDAGLLPGRIPGTPPTRDEFVKAASSQVIPQAVRQLRADQAAQLKRERMYRASVICALLSGLCIVPAILWGLSHL